MQPTEFYQNFLQSKYLVLLLAILAMLLGMPVMDDLAISRTIIGASFLFITIGILYGLKDSRHILILSLIGLLVVGFNIAEIETNKMNILSKVFSILFFSYVIVLFCKDIYSSKQKNNDILLGSICVYLLIGICFAWLYMILQMINLDSIIHQASTIPISKRIDFFYFSFITMATVGYGDIVAQSGFAKSIAITQSIVGLFYMTLMVARLVSIFNK